MFKKLAMSGVGVMLLISPLISSAQTIDIASQIASLLAQIKALQTQIAQLQGIQSSSSCVDLPRNLTLGSTDDVSNLQKYLIARGYLDAQYATGYYGFLTAQAVGKLQLNLSLVSSTNDTAYGITGPRTRAAIACGGIQTNPPSNPYTPPTPPSINSFSGPPTIKVGEQGTWRIPSMDGSCLSIDWGDRSLRTGMCDGAATFSHAYTAPGTYTITATVGTDQVGVTRTIAQTTVVVTSAVAVSNPVCGQPRFVCPATASCALSSTRTYSSRSALDAEGAIFMHEGACKGVTPCTNYVPNQREYYDDGERVSCVSGMDGVTCMNGPAYSCSSGKWQMDSGYDLLGNVGMCKVYGNGYNRCTRSKPGEPLVCASAQTNLGLGCLDTNTSSIQGPSSLRTKEIGTWKIPEWNGSCVTISWGDNSPNAGMCDGSASFEHAYQSSGTYTITATNSGLTRTANVDVRDYIGY